MYSKMFRSTVLGGGVTAAVVAAAAVAVAAVVFDVVAFTAAITATIAHASSDATAIALTDVIANATKAVRRRGSPIRPYWWDQPMDLDLAKERGLLLVQGPVGPAIVEDENED